MRFPPREHPGDEVHLVPRRAGDDEVSAADARVREVLPTRPVAFVDDHVEPAGYRLQT